jgi:hypothetical protein
VSQNETICLGVTQDSYLGPLFFIDDVEGALRIFEHVSALSYADDLKLFKQIVSVEDCQRFHFDLDRWQNWCSLCFTLISLLADLRIP